MVDEHIVRAIIDVAVFLEYTTEDLINQDAAVSAMEQLAFELNQMDDSSKADVSKAMVMLSEEYSDKVAFVAELPEHFGLL